MPVDFNTVKKLAPEEQIRELKTIVERLISEIAELEKAKTQVDEHKLALEITKEIEEQKKELKEAEFHLALAEEEARAPREERAAQKPQSLETEIKEQPRDQQLEAILTQKQEETKESDIQKITEAYKTNKGYETRAYEKREDAYKKMYQEEKQKENQIVEKAQSLLTAGEKIETLYQKSKAYQ